MEQKIIEKPASGEDDVTQSTEISEKVIANDKKTNNHTKHNKKRHYHRWTIDEDELIIRTVLIDNYNNKQINWKNVAAELNNECNADACKAHYHRALRQSLIQIYRKYKSYLRSKVIGDMKEQINCLTNAYIFCCEIDKTLKKEHLQK